MKYIFAVLVFLTHPLCAQMNLEGSLNQIPASGSNTVDFENTIGPENPEKKNSYSGETEKSVIPGHLTDPRDGHIYRTIRINDKIWMAENLAYLPKMNVSQIVYEDLAYISQNDGFRIKQIDDITFEFTFNVLYNYETAKDVCPAGWHLPDDTEWSEMEDRLRQLSTDDGENVDLFMPFSTNNTDKNINERKNTSQLNDNYTNSGYFLSLSSKPAWWTSTNSGETEFGVSREYYSSGFSFTTQNIHTAEGLSVRCIKD